MRIFSELFFLCTLGKVSLLKHKRHLKRVIRIFHTEISFLSYINRRKSIYRKNPGNTAGVRNCSDDFERFPKNGGLTRYREISLTVCMGQSRAREYD